MLTVLFATRNGSRTLPLVLEAYHRLRAPLGGWKLVVVDNGSTDRSLELLQSFQDKLPLTCLSEPKLGKNAALNAGLTHVEGDLVVLSDDDALPDPRWLENLRKAADANPTYSIFGGAVLPHWEVTPPEWVVSWVPSEPVYTLTAPSLSEGPVDPPLVVGPNMAVRASVFSDGFRFDPTIGPQGHSYAMGSETEFVKRLARHGNRAWYVSDARVKHYIRDFQMTRSWILRRGVRLGRGLYRLGELERGDDLPRWAGIPRHLFREAAVESVTLLKGAVLFQKETRFRARWNLNVLVGKMTEAYHSATIGTKSLPASSSRGGATTSHREVVRVATDWAEDGLHVAPDRARRAAIVSSPIDGFRTQESNAE